MIAALKNFEGLNITFNTNEDCNLACKYDLLEGTKILMGDLSEKNIEDVNKGDMIIGFGETHIKGKLRRLCYAIVEDCGFTRMVNEAYEYKTLSTALYATGEHPVLNQRNVFQDTETFYKSKAQNKKVCVIAKGEKLSYKRSDVAIKKINFSTKKKAFNLTTSSGTFIANDILVHNCYEIEKKHKTLPLEYAKKFIDWILTDPDPIGCKGTKDEWIIEQGLILDFIGGDSFMHVDLMDKILQYFTYRVNTITPNHKWANNWRASISSNGTLFERKECRDFILKWKDVLSLGISIDGCPAIHDKNRIFAERGPNGEEIGSMETILKWWPWLRKVNWSICDSTKATCSKDSIPYLAESLKFMHEEMGITHINQNFIMEDMGATADDYEELERQLDKCVDYVLANRGKIYWSMLDERFLKRISDPDVDLDEGWCGSGAMPALAVNGKIYPCFRWLPHTQEHENRSEEYCVGDVWRGFDRKENFRKVREATRLKISPKECLECEYEPCCSVCIGGCYSEFGCFKRTTHICEATKIIARKAEKYWREYDRLEGTDHFTKLTNA
jgi:uncharacterized protein